MRKSESISFFFFLFAAEANTYVRVICGKYMEKVYCFGNVQCSAAMAEPLEKLIYADEKLKVYDLKNERSCANLARKTCIVWPGPENRVKKFPVVVIVIKRNKIMSAFTQHYFIMGAIKRNSGILNGPASVS